MDAAHAKETYIPNFSCSTGHVGVAWWCWYYPNVDYGHALDNQIDFSHRSWIKGNAVLRCFCFSYLPSSSSDFWFRGNHQKREFFHKSIIGNCSIDHLSELAKYLHCTRLRVAIWWSYPNPKPWLRLFWCVLIANSDVSQQILINMESVIFIQISKFQIAYNKHALFVVGRITHISKKILYLANINSTSTKTN